VKWRGCCLPSLASRSPGVGAFPTPAGSGGPDPFQRKGVFWPPKTRNPLGHASRAARFWAACQIPAANRQPLARSAVRPGLAVGHPRPAVRPTVEASLPALVRGIKPGQRFGPSAGANPGLGNKVSAVARITRCLGNGALCTTSALGPDRGPPRAATRPCRAGKAAPQDRPPPAPARPSPHGHNRANRLFPCPPVGNCADHATRFRL